MIDAGTRIRFTKTLDDPASGDHPALLYAKKGEIGVIGEGVSNEGYWAKVDGVDSWFGISGDEFEILTHNAELRRAADEL